MIHNTPKYDELKTNVISWLPDLVATLPAERSAAEELIEAIIRRATTELVWFDASRPFCQRYVIRLVKELERETGDALRTLRENSRG